MAIDFTRYQPPGIYTEDVGGPQLAVRSSVPTAVAIFGTSVGYRTFRESIKINADGTDGLPSLNDTLTKTGVKVVTGLPVVIADGNVSLAAPGSTIHGIATASPTSPASDVSVSNNNLVYLGAQTDSTQNGLYKFKGASTALEVVVDSFKVVNPSTGTAYINGLDYVIIRVSTNNTPDNDRDDLYTMSSRSATATPALIARAPRTATTSMFTPITTTTMSATTTGSRSTRTVTSNPRSPWPQSSRSSTVLRPS